MQRNRISKIFHMLILNFALKTNVASLKIAVDKLDFD